MHSTLTAIPRGHTAITLYVEPDSKGSGLHLLDNGLYVHGTWTALVAEGSTVDVHRFREARTREDAEKAIRQALRIPRRALEWEARGGKVPRAWRTVVKLRRR